VAKCEQITTLDKSFLVRGPFAGVIRAALMQEIETAIRRAIGIPVPWPSSPI
jgi:mRNA-degrading endonuclease toxin of MazEF toxin-antitoxin module